MEVGARTVLAATLAARGSRREAGEHARIMLARAREIGDPQALWGALGECARHAVDNGRSRRSAQALVGELAAALSADESFQIDVHELAGFVAAAALGLGHEFGAHLGKAAYDSPWVDAARQIADGRLDEAGLRSTPTGLTPTPRWCGFSRRSWPGARRRAARRDGLLRERRGDRVRRACRGRFYARSGD